MRCPECEHENTGSQLKCTECGYDFLSGLDATIQPLTKTPKPAAEFAGDPAADATPDAVEGSGPTDGDGTEEPAEQAETPADANPTPPADMQFEPTIVQMPTPTPAPEGKGEIIAERYEVKRVLGVGGMGSVFLAHDQTMGRDVAIKTMQSLDESSRKRFISEARAIAGLNHSYICQVYDYIEKGPEPVIVMEYVRGKTLKGEVVDNGPMPYDRLRRVAIGVAEALQYCHENQVLHRDIKPANILLDGKDNPKVIDFGLGRQGDGAGAELTQTGMGMGTEAYASPEQRLDAKNVDARTDIYSFGLTLYYSCTGESPHVIRESRIPEEWREIVLKCTEVQPDDRYTSMEEVAVLLRGQTSRGSAGASDIDKSGGPQCASCGAVNLPNARFCRKCRAGLLVKCPSCKSEERDDGSFCSKCGYDIPAWKEFEERLRKAQIHFDRNEYFEAGEEARSAQALMPDRPEAGELLARIEELQSRVRETRQAARTAHAKGEYKQAVQLFEQLIGLEPEDVTASTALSECKRAHFDQLVAQIETMIGSGKFDKARRSIAKVAASKYATQNERPILDELRQRVDDDKSAIFDEATQRFNAALEEPGNAPEAEAILVEIQEAGASQLVVDGLRARLSYYNDEATLATATGGNDWSGSLTVLESMNPSDVPGDAATRSQRSETFRASATQVFEGALAAGEIDTADGVISVLHRNGERPSQLKELEARLARARSARNRKKQLIALAVLLVVGGGGLFGGWQYLRGTNQEVLGTALNTVAQGRRADLSKFVDIPPAMRSLLPASFDLGWPEKGMVEKLNTQFPEAGELGTNDLLALEELTQTVAASLGGHAAITAAIGTTVSERLSLTAPTELWVQDGGLITPWGGHPVAGLALIDDAAGRTELVAASGGSGFNLGAANVPATGRLELTDPYGHKVEVPIEAAPEPQSDSPTPGPGEGDVELGDALAAGDEAGADALANADSTETEDADLGAPEIEALDDGSQEVPSLDEASLAEGSEPPDTDPLTTSEAALAATPSITGWSPLPGPEALAFFERDLGQPNHPPALATLGQRVLEGRLAALPITWADRLKATTALQTLAADVRSFGIERDHAGLSAVIAEIEGLSDGEWGSIPKAIVDSDVFDLDPESSTIVQDIRGGYPASLFHQPTGARMVFVPSGFAADDEVDGAAWYQRGFYIAEQVMHQAHLPQGSSLQVDPENPSVYASADQAGDVALALPADGMLEFPTAIQIRRAQLIDELLKNGAPEDSNVLPAAFLGSPHWYRPAVDELPIAGAMTGPPPPTHHTAWPTGAYIRPVLRLTVEEPDATELRLAVASGANWGSWNKARDVRVQTSYTAEDLPPGTQVSLFVEPAGGGAAVELPVRGMPDALTAIDLSQVTDGKWRLRGEVVGTEGVPIPLGLFKSLTSDVSARQRDLWIDSSPPVMGAPETQKKIQTLIALVTAVTDAQSGLADVQLNGLPLTHRADGLWEANGINAISPVGESELCRLIATDRAGNSLEIDLDFMADDTEQLVADLSMAFETPIPHVMAGDDPDVRLLPRTRAGSVVTVSARVTMAEGARVSIGDQSVTQQVEDGGRDNVLVTADVLLPEEDGAITLSFGGQEHSALRIRYIDGPLLNLTSPSEIETDAITSPEISLEVAGELGGTLDITSSIATDTISDGGEREFTADGTQIVRFSVTMDTLSNDGSARTKIEGRRTIRAVASDAIGQRSVPAEIMIVYDESEPVVEKRTFNGSSGEKETSCNLHEDSSGNICGWVVAEPDDVVKYSVWISEAVEWANPEHPPRDAAFNSTKMAIEILFEPEGPTTREVQADVVDGIGNPLSALLHAGVARIGAMGTSDRAVRQVGLGDGGVIHALSDSGSGEFASWVSLAPGSESASHSDDVAAVLRPETLLGSAELTTATALTVDGEYVALGGDSGTIDILGHSRELTYALGDEITALAFDPEGKLLAAAAKGGAVALFDGTVNGTKEALMRFDADDDIVAIACTSAGGGRVAAVSKTQLHIGSTSMGDQVVTVPIPDNGRGTSVALSGDGSRIAVGTDYGTFNFSWQGASLSSAQKNSKRNITAVAFDELGQYALVGTRLGTIWVLAFPERNSTGAPLSTYGSLHKVSSGPSAVTSLVITPDGHRAVAGFANGDLRSWDLPVGFFRP